MPGKRIFRSAHWLLLLASLLCASLVFAPIAYSSNFRNNVYAEVYGSWVRIEHTLEDSPDKTELLAFHQDFFISIYAFLSAATALFLLFVLFFSRNDAQRARRLVYANGLMFFHLTWGIALYFHAGEFVGKAATEYMETGLQREFSLHFFVLVFAWMAKRRYRKSAEQEILAPAIS